MDETLDELRILPEASIRRCSVCGEEDPEGQRAWVCCDLCEVLVHRECWDYVAVCTVYACGGRVARDLDPPDRAERRRRQLDQGRPRLDRGDPLPRSPDLTVFQRYAAPLLMGGILAVTPGNASHLWLPALWLLLQLGHDLVLPCLFRGLRLDNPREQIRLGLELGPLAWVRQRIPFEAVAAVFLTEVEYLRGLRSSSTLPVLLRHQVTLKLASGRWIRVAPGFADREEAVWEALALARHLEVPFRPEPEESEMVAVGTEIPDLSVVWTAEDLAQPRVSLRLPQPPGIRIRQLLARLPATTLVSSIPALVAILVFLPRSGSWWMHWGWTLRFGLVALAVLAAGLLVREIRRGETRALILENSLRKLRIQRISALGAPWEERISWRELRRLRLEIDSADEALLWLEASSGESWLVARQEGPALQSLAERGRLLAEHLGIPLEKIGSGAAIPLA